MKESQNIVKMIAGPFLFFQVNMDHLLITQRHLYIGISKLYLDNLCIKEHIYHPHYTAIVIF